MFIGTTQQFLAIRSIKNGIVQLKSGGHRSVLHVSSLNFALKSMDEQKAIIFEYQNFLNSLDFSIQIVISSRLTNVEAYLESLARAYYQQENELLQIQTREYINFIRDFTAQNKIITTDFYIVIPIIRNKTKKRKGTKEGAVKLERTELTQRVNFVSSGLHRMGLKVHTLNTEDLIALYWSFYNNQDLKKRSLLGSIFQE